MTNIRNLLGPDSDSEESISDEVYSQEVTDQAEKDFYD